MKRSSIIIPENLYWKLKAESTKNKMLLQDYSAMVIKKGLEFFNKKGKDDGKNKN